MPTRVFISTECTQCGGSLNLEEGTHAIACPYCRSSFLVTGYDKVLNYYIPKELDERQTVARSLAYRYLRTLTDHYRIQEINLFYLPFYRLRGKLFQLETDLIQDSSLPDSLEYGQAQVKTRYLDRSFLATRLEGLSVYSLGVRTSVLKLSLFERGELEERGRIYPVTLGIDEAMERGLGMRSKDESDHCVISKILSIVYSPFWEVNVVGVSTSFSIIVDALGEQIIEERAPYQLLTSGLQGQGCRSLPAISFHTLACPNCGWDLTAQPELCVFFCSHCHRAWECGVEGFQEARGSVVLLHSYDTSSSLRYFPFWVLSACDRFTSLRNKRGEVIKLFIPAFTVRDLTVLYRLATAFTRVQPELTLMPLSGDLPSSVMEGAVMRCADARALAEFILGALIVQSPHGKEMAGEPPSRVISSRELIWFPFYEKGIYLRDALLDIGIQKGKICSSRLSEDSKNEQGYT